MSYKNLKLNKDLIPNCILKATNKTIKPTVRTNYKTKIIRYLLDSDSILDLYCNIDGSTTISWSGKEPDFAELVATDIKDTCTVNLPDPTRALYLKNMTQENFDSIIDRFQQHNLTVTNNEDTQHAKRYTINNTTNESIKVHYFPTTGALNFQGKGYSIYSDILEGLEETASVSDVIDSNLTVNNIESITKTDLIRSMQEAMPSTYTFLNGPIINIMASSFFLTRIENDGLADYSWMIFPMLRGLEGAIKKMLLLRGISVNKSFGEVFKPISQGSTTYEFLECHSNSIADANYCNELIKCYHYLIANRHGIFHINGTINTTRLLTRENALDMFNEIIELIEATYQSII